MITFLRNASRAFAVVALGTLAGAAILLGVPASAAAVPFTGGNILVSSGDAVYELTRTGEVVQTIPVWPYARFPFGATDMVVDRDGNLQILNRNQNPPTLDTYNPMTGVWKSRPVPGTQPANVLDRIATADRYLYVPIQLYGSVWPRYYLVRIDITDDSSERFPLADVLNDLDIGPDGLLYVLISDASFSNQLVDARDPATMATVRSFPHYGPIIYNELAANTQGEIFATKLQTLYHLAADGTELGSITVNLPGNLSDVEVSRDGAVVVGTGRTATISLTNESLDSPTPLVVPETFSYYGYDARYVAFVPCKDGDSDCDDVTDAEEAALGTDPASRDSDGDGLVDGEEVNFYHSDPLAADSDGDGLSDDREVRVTRTDPIKVDTDGDGLSDPQEINSSHTDPLKADTDGDGLNDSEELAAQTDPMKADTDGDGLTDGREVHDVHSNPLLADTDGDGLNDLEEVQDGTSPVVVDTDGDGFTDYQEVRIWGTSPDSRSIPYQFDGTITLSSGGLAQSTRVPLLLILSADRTYVFGVPGNGSGEPGVPERGTWYVNRGQILFYQQNLFEYLKELGDEVQPQLGPVTIILRSNVRTVAFNERSHALSVRGAANFTFVRGTGAPPLALTFADKGVGTFSEIPIPAPSSAGDPPPALSVPAAGPLTQPSLSVTFRPWLVSGTLVTRTGKTTESHAISGVLLFHADQTFEFDLGQGETPMRGMWFQDGTRILLYSQNLLEQSLAVERSLSIATGEPVRAELLQVRDEARSDSRTGGLLLTLDHRYATALARSGQTLAVSSTWKLTAKPAP